MKVMGHRRAMLLLGGGLWVILLAAGWVQVTEYATVPSAQGVVPAEWPEATPFHRTEVQPTLVVLAHPHCPCTQATISELERLMARLHGQLETHVLFFKPEKLPESWIQTGLWTRAEAIPGVTVHVDEAGREAARFGALASGQTLLFDADGTRVFAGGITPARGHEGPNTGTEAIAAWVTASPHARSQSPVFGCSLQEEAELAVVL